MTAELLWFLAPLGGVAALLVAWRSWRLVLGAPQGDGDAERIAGLVLGGARAYLRSQYAVQAVVFGTAFLALLALAFILRALPRPVPFAFLTGGLLSALCAALGMLATVRATGRVAHAARESTAGALVIAFRSGAAAGLLMAGAFLLEICLWFAVLYWVAPAVHPAWKMDPGELTLVMLAFGLGASLQACLARLGGCIFAKGADVGADMVSQIEAGIPEDEERNPAVLADSIGDAVGGPYGAAADLYESCALAVLASAALGAAAFASVADPDERLPLQLAAATFPVIVAGLGALLSAAAAFLARAATGAAAGNLRGWLGRPAKVASVGLGALSGLIVWMAFGPDQLGLWGALVAGLLAGGVIARSAEYQSSGDFAPVRALAARSEWGAAAVIHSGLSASMVSTWLPVFSAGALVITAYFFAGGGSSAELGLYGMGLAAVGMLCTPGIALATWACGPIADMAGTNVQLSGAGEAARERLDALNGLGKAGAAAGKGLAIGAAAVTAMALLGAYAWAVRGGLALKGTLTAEHGGNVISAAAMPLNQLLAYFHVTLTSPCLLAGMLIGGTAAFLFAGLSVRAVGRAGARLVEEVRRQFKTVPGLMAGQPQARPDFAICVNVLARSARREMIPPGVLAVVLPLGAGLLLGVAGVMGLLLGALVTAFPLAVFMTSAGGSWDSARKHIESGRHGGRGSGNHKAAVVGDVVGDPFKDVSGPGLSTFLKLMSMVSLVTAGLIVRLVGNGSLVDRLAAVFRGFSG